LSGAEQGAASEEQCRKCLAEVRVERRDLFSLGIPNSAERSDDGRLTDLFARPSHSPALEMPSRLLAVGERGTLTAVATSTILVLT